MFEETGVTRRDYIQQWFDSHPRATAAQRQEFLSGRRNVHFFFNRITDEKLAMDANLYNSLMVRLLVGNLFIYGFPFLTFLFVNLFTVLVVYALLFHYRLYRSRRSAGYEE